MGMLTKQNDLYLMFTRVRGSLSVFLSILALAATTLRRGGGL